MVVHVHHNTAFENMTKEQLEQFCILREFALVGSAVFVKNKAFISKIISWVCLGKAESKDFVPSHVGSLILAGGHVYLFDMKPPRPTLTRFDEYLANTKDEFILVMRNFYLDTEKFSLEILKRYNKPYGYLSAIQSAFKYLWWGFKEHCSEIHLKALQAQGLFKEYDANKTTPEDLKEILLKYDEIGGVVKND